MSISSPSSSSRPPRREARPQSALAHRLRQWQQKQGRVATNEDLAALAKPLRAPLSQLRSVASFFDEFRKADGERFCADPACAIARGFAGTEATIGCPGRCAEGPVRISARGELIADGEAEPRVRNLAPEPRLTAPSLERVAEICQSELSRETDPAAATMARLKGVTNLNRHRRKRNRSLIERWREAAATGGKDGQRFLVCHADAGNPGTSANAWLLRKRTRAVLDGMAIAGLAVGADEGVICVPHDQPEVFTAVDETLRSRECETGIELTPITTFGSHVGGEETALLNAIEGHRGEARLRPPEPERAGLFGLPTVIETAEVFALLPEWLTGGTDPGNRLVTVTPPFARPGMVEIDASISFRRLTREAAEPEAGAAACEALFFGGPFGSLVFPEDWDLRLDTGILAEHGLAPGHWGLTPIPAGTEPRNIAIALLAFAARESCGKCVPCRLGPSAALELMKSSDTNNRQRLREIFRTIAQTSLCGFGRNFPRPLVQLIERWGIETLFSGNSG